jgi:hypothetical protein
MPKKKTTEIVRPLNAKTSTGKTTQSPAVHPKPIPIETAMPAAKERSEAVVVEDLSQFPPAFENKAGRYELIRVDGGQAYYSFTNRQEKTVDATMSVITWRKMQERALAALKETA